MNKFKFGDKVMIKTMNQEGTILGWEHKIINGIDHGYTYTVKTFIEGNIPVIGTAREKDLEPKIPTPQEVLDVVDKIGIDNAINCFEKENDSMRKAKFKIGDKVHIIAFGDDKIWEVVRIKSVFHCEKWSPMGSDDDTDYFYRIINKDNGSIKALKDVPERHLKLVDDDIVIKFKNGSYVKVIPGKNEFSCNCCSYDVYKDSDFNENKDNFKNESDDDEIEDYRHNKEAENLDNNKQFNLGNLATSPTYPEIEDYYYDGKTATTVIKWSDNTTTKVKASADDKPNQYAGFAFAVAKKYFGNGNKSMKEAHWFIDVCPEMDKELDRAFAEYVQDEERKKAKREMKREKRIIKAKALARKREYEARKVAAEKYDVPMDWNEDNE